MKHLSRVGEIAKKYGYKPQMGAYTSIRMLVFTGAQAVATLIITPLVNVIGYKGLLVFASVMQLICGLTYWLVAKIRKRKIENI